MLNTIQDIERYNVTVRLDKTAYVGDLIVHLRATPQFMVGASITFEPGTARVETRLVTAVEEHAVTLSTALTYRHEIDTPAIRLDLLSTSGSSDSLTLAADASAGASSVDLSYIPSWVKIGAYVFIDAYTVQCEVRKITSITGNSIVFGTVLAYNHLSGDISFFQETDVINVRWFGAVGNGVLDCHPLIQAAVNAAANTDSKDVYIPGGTYLLKTSADITMGSTSGLRLHGDGMGKTILKIEDNFNWTWAGAHVVEMTGEYQVLEDLSITAGPGMNSDGNTAGITVVSITEYWVDSKTAYCCIVRNIEIYGIVGGVLASGGNGVGTYCSWNEIEVDTTMASAVSAPGSVVVTPVSMNGIFRGRRLFIEYVSDTVCNEEVVVTDIDKTTFTATFANTHAIGARVVAYTQSKTDHLIENVYVHDCHQITAFGAGSNGNTWRKCRAVRGSGLSTTHGFYNSGGNNLFEDCWIEGWAGYSYHNYKQTYRREKSGDKFINCVSINPQYQHLITDSLGNIAASPYNTDYPVGAELDRYTIIRGCTFIHTNGYVSGAGITVHHPAIIENCTFDDVYTGGGGGVIDATATAAPPVIIKGNYFRYLNEPISAVNMYGIRCNNAIVEGNIFDNKDRASGVIFIRTTAGTNHIKNNKLYNSKIQCHSTDIVEGNEVVNTIDFEPYNGGGSVLRNNKFTRATTALLATQDLSASVLLCEGNDFDGLQLKSLTVAISADLLFRNNKGMFGGAGAVANLTYKSGSLKMYLASGTVTYRRCVELSGDSVNVCGTSDTEFIGVAVMTAANTDSVMIAMDIGAEVEIDADDAWTAGNYGVLSTGTAGKIHDNGSTKADSFVLFLDSGIAAGVAKCRLIKTL